MKANKFYKTLPAKIQQAEQEWLESQPELEKPQARFYEEPPDGSDAQRILGGSLGFKYEFETDDDFPNGEAR